MGAAAVESAAVDPQRRPFRLGEEAGEIGHDRDRNVLDRPRGRAADGRRHAGRLVRGQHDAGRPRALGAARDGAEVARIGDLVEADEQRLAAPRASSPASAYGYGSTRATTP